MPTHTEQDLEMAKRRLEKWEKAWENYDGNNPAKFRGEIKSAQFKVWQIEEALKEAKR